jgi:radical SAM superfamily enzyme YgiQ (UPF0313 family)
VDAVSGYPVVLTADRTLTAGYRLLFDGILACAQTTTTPYPVLRALMLPKTRGTGVRARLAPLGLRRIEAALLDGGFARDDVAVVDHDHLAEAIGPNTRVVGIATGDPAGVGMSTTTMTAVAGGTGYTTALFRRVLKTVHRAAKRAGAKPRIIIGGPGSWQLARDRDLAETLGIDHVVSGYAEANAAKVFRGLAEGTALPDVIIGEGLPAEKIPGIRGATTMGVIEISRGCGLGCSFCTIANVPMQHLPEDTILCDAQTNLDAGVRHLCTISEDLFRYGATGRDAEPEALIRLLQAIRRLECVGLIQTDHGNVLSVSQYSDEQLRTVRQLMVGDTGQEYPWVNIGVETASGALLRSAGCGPKMGGWSDDDWPAVCTDQLGRLCRAGFFPMASLVVGLPGEKPDDLRRTIQWLDTIRHLRLAVFPVVYAPVDGSVPPTLTKLRWQLIRECYRFNFKWVPKMYWDNQRAAGVPAAQRCLMQMLGRGQALLWKLLFRWRSMRSPDA